MTSTWDPRRLRGGPEIIYRRTGISVPGQPMKFLWMVLALTASVAAQAAGRAPAAVRGAIGPAAGRLLVAEEHLRDPNFARSVVLLLRYGPGGAMGVIVNRPLPVPVSHVLPEIEAFARRGDVIHLGGPVSMNTAVVVFRGGPKVEGSRRVFDGVSFTMSRSGLEELARHVKEADLRVFAGYAGWAPGQLDAEIARGDWQVMVARPEDVFSADPASLWERLRERGGQGQWVRWTGAIPGGLARRVRFRRSIRPVEREPAPLRSPEQFAHVALERVADPGDDPFTKAPLGAREGRSRQIP